MPPADYAHTELALALTETRPPLSEMTVKTVDHPSLLGERATVAVLGSSHYVGSDALGVHEVCTCRPDALEADAVTVPLEPGIERHLTFTTAEHSLAVRVRGRPLDAFDPAGADVRYEFDADAYTTVTVGPRGYRTCHTYPEFDLALHTETAIAPRDEGTASVHGPGTTVPTGPQADPNDAD